MSRPAITITLPADAPSTWADEVIDRFGRAAQRLAGDLHLPPPSLVILRGREGAALASDAGLPWVAAGEEPASVARGLAEGLQARLWEILLRPGLAGLGLNDGNAFWLRQGGRRGLPMEKLAELAGSFSDGTALAWQLASAEPPSLLLQAGAGALATLADEARRHDAAMEAARATGLPIPIPREPMRDLAVGEDEAALMLGVLRHLLPGLDDLAACLARTAVALVDPGLAIALCTDPQRIPRRLAASALRGDGAVRIAERLIAAFERGEAPLDILGIVEEAAGLAPAQ